MASGTSLFEAKRRGIRYCASNSYPFGTRLHVTSAKGKRTSCIVLDRGPKRSLGRTIDLNKKSFSELASIDDGLVWVGVERA